jgi:uncharacterized protein YjeT (DUF2065 family)
MFDFLAAIGLFFAIEGILFAAFPLGTKRAMAAALDMPDGRLRVMASSRRSWESPSSGWYGISPRASARAASSAMASAQPGNGSRGRRLEGEAVLKAVLRQNVPAARFNRRQSHRKCLSRLKGCIET